MNFIEKGTYTWSQELTYRSSHIWFGMFDKKRKLLVRCEPTLEHSTGIPERTKASIVQQRQEGVSLLLASSPNEFSWVGNFIDCVSIRSILWEIRRRLRITDAKASSDF